LDGEAFKEVDTRRRAQKLAQVLEAFERAGLVDNGHITHPPPA
jgi:hypothetical protein